MSSRSHHTSPLRRLRRVASRFPQEAVALARRLWWSAEIDALYTALLMRDDDTARRHLAFLQKKLGRLDPSVATAETMIGRRRAAVQPV